MQFNTSNHESFPLSTPTRFVSSEKDNTPIDLRSIYFAWQKKDVAIPEYIASAQQLNEELEAEGGAGGKVQNLVFVERLDLITWLEGASDESEYIKPLESEAAAAAAAGSAQVSSGAAGGIATVPSAAAGGRPGRVIDPRLAEIYNGERRMGDRNSVLRGIKPTVGLVRRSEDDSADRGLSLVGLLSRSQDGRDFLRSQSNPARSSYCHRGSKRYRQPSAGRITQETRSTS